MKDFVPFLAVMLGALLGTSLTFVFGIRLFRKQKRIEVSLQVLREMISNFVELSDLRRAGGNEGRLRDCRLRIETNLILCDVYFGSRIRQTLTGMLMANGTERIEDIELQRIVSVVREMVTVIR